jgi:hypothetical protein
MKTEVLNGGKVKTITSVESSFILQAGSDLRKSGVRSFHWCGGIYPVNASYWFSA